MRLEIDALLINAIHKQPTNYQAQTLAMSMRGVLYLYVEPQDFEDRKMV